MQKLFRNWDRPIANSLLLNNPFKYLIILNQYCPTASGQFMARAEFYGGNSRISRTINSYEKVPITYFALTLLAGIVTATKRVLTHTVGRFFSFLRQI